MKPLTRQIQQRVFQEEIDHWNDLDSASRDGFYADAKHDQRALGRWEQNEGSRFTKRFFVGRDAALGRAIACAYEARVAAVPS